MLSCSTDLMVGFCFTCSIDAVLISRMIRLHHLGTVTLLISLFSSMHCNTERTRGLVELEYHSDNFYFILCHVVDLDCASLTLKSKPRLISLCIHNMTWALTLQVLHMLKSYHACRWCHRLIPNAKIAIQSGSLPGFVLQILNLHGKRLETRRSWNWSCLQLKLSCQQFKHCIIEGFVENAFRGLRGVFSWSWFLV